MRISWLTLGIHPKDELLNMSQLCEQAGMDTFWYADERFFMECYSSLTLCSTQTQRIKLGPGVTDPFSRHPALTAMAIGTLDQFSDGRAVLGLGAGNSGFRELLIKRIHPAQAVRETVQVVNALLAGERVSLDGKVIKLQNCKLGFEPRGPVPTIIASNGQLIIRVAGEVADGVMSSSVLVQPRVDEVLALVDDGLRIAGRQRSDFSVWSRLNIAAHHDTKQAYRALKPHIYNLICGKYPDTGMFDRLDLPLPADLRHTVETVGNTRDPEQLNWIVEQVPDEFIAKTCLVGSPTHIIGQLRNLAQAGFDGAVLYPVPVEGQSFTELLTLVAQEIMPSLAGSQPAASRPG
jgi:5,10-methylenetetrahydromethanopterin reductase